MVFRGKKRMKNAWHVVYGSSGSVGESKENLIDDRTFY